MKSRVFAVLSLTILMCAVLSLCAYAAVGGDVNGDGKLANDDLSMLVSFLSRNNESVKIANLDVDNNGKVNNRDAILVAQALGGWDVDLYTGIGSDGADIDVSELR